MTNNSGARSMKGIRVLITCIAVCIAVTTVASFSLLRVPHTWSGDWRSFHVSFAASFVYASLYATSATIFLLGIKGYKRRLRFAYILFATGMALIALGTEQLVVLYSYGLEHSFWVGAGVANAPFLLAGILGYVGVRTVARLIGVTSLATSLSLASVLSAAAIVLIIWLPHASASVPEAQLDAGNATLAGITPFNIMAAILAFRIRRHIGAHYTNAMAWLFVTIAGGVVVQLIAIGYSLAQVQSLGLLAALSNVVVAAVAVRAGYAFAKTRDY